MRVVCFKAEDHLIDQLNKLSIKLRKSRSQIIREALTKYIREHEVREYGYYVIRYELT
jgi:metal-responsive CopG/Arc/MetJ family transcriptional regulator